MTASQRAALRRVHRNRPNWTRAANAGERVTLASLHRAGALERRAWRGVEGDPDAAHEYRVAPAVLARFEGRAAEWFVGSRRVAS